MKRSAKLVLIALVVALLGAAATGVILVAMIAAYWSDPYGRHFTAPLPPTAKLLHYEKRRAGFEVRYAFVFEVSDAKLMDQIVREWSLTRAGVSANEPISMVALRPPPWWLNKDGLKALPDRYRWVHPTEQRYRSAWFDPATGKLYAEYGRW